MQAFSDSLPMMLYGAIDAVMPRFRRIFKRFGLTEQQWRVLRVLWEQGPVNTLDLARHTRIPAPSLVGVVDRLTASGLVMRQRSSDDRRRVLVSATNKGRALHKDVQPAVLEAYTDLRMSIEDNTWDELLRGLALIANLQSSTEQGIAA